MAKILFYQSADVACMQTHDLLMGFNELGHEVHSNILNYPFLRPIGRDNEFDYQFVSTSGALCLPYYPKGRYAFIDGRDTNWIEQGQLERADVYFKTNSVSHRVRKLPTCVDPKWLKEPGERSIKCSFMTGHGERGRDKVIEWCKKAGVKLDLELDDRKALNPIYPAESCNIYSQKYHDVLQDCEAAINAPGGGVMTKRFFEAMASGCALLNFVPERYHQETANILDTIPDSLNFPKEAVLNFSNEKELKEALNNISIENAQKTYEWAKSWTFKEKAAYVLSMM